MVFCSQFSKYKLHTPAEECQSVDLGFLRRKAVPTNMVYVNPHLNTGDTGVSRPMHIE